MGSGIAGLYCALLAQQYGSVQIITKGSLEDCNSRHAQGGIAAAVGEDDSAELHFKDTMAAGAGLSYDRAVNILTAEAADRIADLVRMGVPFDTIGGVAALTREAAHSVPRILHAGGDATGARIETTLSRRLRHLRIPVMENCLATEILTDSGRVVGLRTFDCHTGIRQDFSCLFLIMASGGAGQLFSFTTNPEVATGDGIAIAYAAGVEIADMEFFQFHPTALRLPGVSPFLISEAVRGEGGILRNEQREAFMSGYAAQAELAPRDVVARSIAREMAKTGTDHVYLDVTHLPGYLTAARFPQIYRFCLDHGLDITTELIPVAPAAHYMIGGIRVDTFGRSTLPGLFAAGEVACTGVHGANRLASNSLLEVLVFTHRIVQTTVGDIPADDTPHWNDDCRVTLGSDFPDRKASVPSRVSLQHLLWEKVGIMRDGPGLVEAVTTLCAWQNCLTEAVDRPSWEMANLITVGRLMAESALLRTESRGAHYRCDYPAADENWRHHIIQVKDA